MCTHFSCWCDVPACIYSHVHALGWFTSASYITMDHSLQPVSTYKTPDNILAMSPPPLSIISLTIMVFLSDFHIHQPSTHSLPLSSLDRDTSPLCKNVHIYFIFVTLIKGLDTRLEFPTRWCLLGLTAWKLKLEETVFVHSVVMRNEVWLTHFACCCPRL